MGKKQNKKISNSQNYQSGLYPLLNIQNQMVNQIGIAHGEIIHGVI